MPVFGQRTLEAMREAGIAAAAVEAGKVILLDRPAVLAQAKSWSIPLLGIS